MFAIKIKILIYKFSRFIERYSSIEYNSDFQKTKYKDID